MTRDKERGQRSEVSMEQQEPGEETSRRTAKKQLLTFAVAAALFLASCCYLVGAMLGLWGISDWVAVLAAAVLAGSIAFARLSTR